VITWLEDRITQWPPASRRRAAVVLFVLSTVLMTVNIAAFLIGWIGDSGMLFITLVLSWLAIGLTLLDLIATTDVREESDEQQESVQTPSG
jgi:hypothetical protein